MLDMGFMPDIQRILELLPTAPADAAVLGDVLGRHQAPRGLDPAATPVTIEVARHGTAAESVRQLVYPVDRDRKEELLAHLDRRGRLAPGARVHPDEARGVAPGVVARPARRRRDGDPLRPRPVRPDQGARGVQGGRDPGPRRDRRRGPRPRHRGPAARRELRAAVEPRGLRPPHRPHGPRRARRATRSASCASTRRTCCAASSGCSGVRSRGTVEPGLRAAQRDAEPSRSARRAGRRAVAGASRPRAGRRSRSGSSQPPPLGGRLTAGPSRPASPSAPSSPGRRSGSSCASARRGRRMPWLVRIGDRQPSGPAGSGPRSGSRGSVRSGRARPARDRTGWMPRP